MLRGGGLCLCSQHSGELLFLCAYPSTRNDIPSSAGGSWISLTLPALPVLLRPLSEDRNGVEGDCGWTRGLLLPLLLPATRGVLPFRFFPLPLPRTGSKSDKTFLATCLASASSINCLISSATSSSRSIKASAMAMTASRCSWKSCLIAL